jgi:hypothetical protein
VILSFASDYQRHRTVSAKLIEAATEQNNDYKLAFVQFIVAAQMEVTSHLNFRTLVTLGNLLLFPIAYLVWLLSTRRQLTALPTDGVPADQYAVFLA